MSEDEAGTVGFIGLGDQGGPIARRIADAGRPLAVWGRRRETVAPFVAAGARDERSPARLGEVSWLVGVCVRNDDDVRDVVLGDGLLSGMRPGSVLAIHSTVHPDTVREVGAAAAAVGVEVLDAPVSGGSRAAAAGTLTVMVGGDPAVFARVRPVFETFGIPVLLGGIGSGQTAKLINNTVMAANLALARAAGETAAALGLDRGAFLDLLGRSSGRSQALDTLVRVQRARRAGAVEILRKDVGHFRAITVDAGEPAAHLAGVADRCLEFFDEIAAGSARGADDRAPADRADTRSRRNT